MPRRRRQTRRNCTDTAAATPAEHTGRRNTDGTQEVSVEGWNAQDGGRQDDVRRRDEKNDGQEEGQEAVRCRRCAGQLLRSFPDLEPTCLLCGWYPVEIPAWVQAEYEERLGSDE